MSARSTLLVAHPKELIRAGIRQLLDGTAVSIVGEAADATTALALARKVRPDVIVETGIAHGGSLVLSASILELIGAGRVIGIDVDIRKHNREIIDAHPLRHRMELIEGSSIDPAVVAKVRASVGDARTVLVILDSNHTAEHVAAELKAFAPMVTLDSYVVAMDGAQAHVGDIPAARPGWAEDHPLLAIEEFLKTHPEFVVDPYYERMDITSSPSGFLRRVKA